MKLTHVLLVLSSLLGGYAHAGTLKVFILAGQSNMVGHGKAEGGRNPKFDPSGPKTKENPQEIPAGLGCLRAMVNESPAKFGPQGTTPLVDAEGKWLVRHGVKIYAFCNGKTKQGGLGLGFAEPGPLTWFGPEFGFGHSVGNAIDEEVLLIKVSTGGTSLAENWRSPSAVAKRGGEVGPQYAHMVKTINDVLANLDREFPEFTGRKYEVVGFGWHQGWQDGGDSKMAAEYEANMADFIQDVRKDFKSRLVFVIANSGFFGDKQSGLRAEGRQTQDAMADGAKYPQFQGNVTVVDTRPLWRDATVSPSNFGYHWNHNGYTQYEMGARMGEAMLELLK